MRDNVEDVPVVTCFNIKGDLKIDIAERLAAHLDLVIALNQDSEILE